MGLRCPFPVEPYSPCYQAVSIKCKIRCRCIHLGGPRMTFRFLAHNVIPLSGKRPCSTWTCSPFRTWPIIKRTHMSYVGNPQSSPDTRRAIPVWQLMHGRWQHGEPLYIYPREGEFCTSGRRYKSRMSPEERIPSGIPSGSHTSEMVPLVSSLKVKGRMLLSQHLLNQDER